MINRFFLCLVFVIAASGLCSGQNHPQMTPINGSIHILTGVQGGTSNITFSIGPDGTLMVDALLERTAGAIRPALKAANAGPVKFLINTHWHTDHTGGNALFGREAVIIAHPSVRQRVMTEQRPPWEKEPVKPMPPEAWPAITFEQTMSLHFNGEEVKLIHFPASHTDGDTVVYFTKSKVVCMGDTVYLIRNQLMPSPSQWNGGDAESLAKNLEALIPQLPADVKVVPGHGRVLSLGDLKAYHRILAGTIEIVRRGLAEGKKFAEIKSAGLPREFSTLGDWTLPPEDWIGIVYQSLARKIQRKQ